MSRNNDPLSSGQAPMPYPRSSAQQGPVRKSTPVQQPRGYASGPATRNALAVDDLIWNGISLLLGVACFVTLSYWLWRIITKQVDGTKLTILIVVVVIYLLCVAGGWLWGRYQSAPAQEALSRQVEDLERQVNDLLREKQSLQQTIRQQNSAPIRATSNQAASPALRQQPSASAQPPLPPLPPSSIHDQQIEPADTGDLLLHPHEKRFPMPDEQNLLAFNWRLIGASRRGYGHGYEGKYREDDFQIKILNDPAAGPALAVVAIADGLSSKGLSRKGALASVEGATSISESDVASLKALLLQNSPLESVYAAARSILLQSLRRASSAVENVARSSYISVDELHATLMVFLAVPLGPDQLFLARVQIGDGAMFGVRVSNNPNEPPSARWRHLLTAQIQGAGNEVQPFMRSQEKDWYQFMQFDILSKIAGVMAMTDGIADDIEPPPPTPDDPEPDLFSRVDLFQKTYIIPTLNSPRPADELVRFIGYRRAQSIDDRTLIYLYHA